MPGGERAEDGRGRPDRAPGWARDAFGTGLRSGAGARAGLRRGRVLPTGRYALTAAVRYGARGGVFLGRETSSGAEVVVKQARAPMDVDRAGTDARDALRYEAALLDRLAGQRAAPRLLELIEQEGSVFLVQERIAGQPLGSWVAARLRRDGSPDVDWTQAGPVAHGLLDLVERVHARGLVVRDLSPGNVVVRPDGTPRLVDLGLATEAGRLAGAAGAPGYRAPEHRPGRLALAARGCVADPAVDLYALGGLLFLLATGHDPVLPEDLPRARPVAEGLGRWLALAARTGGTARRLAPAVLGLRAEAPERRWAVGRARAALGGDGPDAAGPAAGPPRPCHGGPRLGPAPAAPTVRRRPATPADPSGTTRASGA